MKEDQAIAAAAVAPVVVIVVAMEIVDVEENVESIMKMQVMTITFEE